MSLGVGPAHRTSLPTGFSEWGLGHISHTWNGSLYLLSSEYSFQCNVCSCLLPIIFLLNCVIILKIFYLLFIFREWGREGERQGEKHRCVRETPTGWLLHDPKWGPGLQPRHVPWPGVEPVTFRFASWCSINSLSPTNQVMCNYFYCWVLRVLSIF